MKIVFVTDLHIGATPADFHQQTYWPACHGPVVRALQSLVEQEHADLLLLGGDMTHATRDEELSRFVELLSPFKVPSILCLGNHDVCVSPDADHLAIWGRALRALPRMRLAPAARALPAVDVFALNTRWADPAGVPRLWYPLGSGPVSALTDDDLAWLDESLGENPGKPAILMVHGEVAALPPALATGLEHPIHVPAAAYAAGLLGVLEKHPRVKLVLAGHNHATYAEWQGGRVVTTTGAVSEAPFTARVIEVTKTHITVRTQPLLAPPADVGLDPAKRWALGRESDQAFMIPLG